MNGTVSEIFSVEVLSFIPDSVSFVANYWDSNLLGLSLFLYFLRMYSGFKTLRHRAVVFIRTNISHIKSRSKWVNIKEWVFSMVNLSNWRSVKRLVTLVADSRQIGPRSFLLNFNSLKPLKIVKNNKFTYSASWNSLASY